MMKTLISEGLSQSVVGAAHSSFVSKHCQHPAQVLTLDEISHLSDSAFDANHVKVISVHLFCCFMAGARWHDSVMCITNIDI